MSSACALVCGPAGAASAFAEPLTFSRDVAPLLYRHCADCHRPRDMAPFSVLTYRDVKPWVPLIRERVRAREMPPWHADPRYGDFANDARLSEQAIATIVAWVDQGAREGDPRELPPPPPHVEGWSIGKPHRILVMSQDYTIEPGAPDAYVYVTFPLRFTEDRWVQAAEIRPGNKRVVHHVIAHVLGPRAGSGTPGVGGESAIDLESERSIFFKQGALSRVKMDAPVIDDGANAPNGGAVYKPRTPEDGGGSFSTLLASYAPGKGSDVYAPGTAKRIAAGSTIVLQIHYSSFHGTLRRAETDRTSVGLVFAKAPPDKQVVTHTIPNHLFKIPPLAGNHEVTAAYTFTRDVQVISYMPHMHLRGKDMKYEIVSPDGRRETLLWVPRFNFNWQTVYRLKRPVTISKGTRMIVTAHFDNSARNKYNPDPTTAVRWGDPTSDEMMIGWLDYLVPNPRAPGAVAR